MTSEQAIVAVVDALEGLQIPYMLVGSLSSSAYGIARSSKDAVALYYCACVYALAAGATKGDAELSMRYADRGIAVLRQSIAAGFQNAEHMRKDPDLDSLRGREEFRQLFKKLQEKTPQN